jgi:hypothetical protein
MFRGKNTKAYFTVNLPPCQKIEKEDNTCLIELSAKKFELLKIMNDYFNKKATRVETTGKLDELATKSA